MVTHGCNTGLLAWLPCALLLGGAPALASDFPVAKLLTASLQLFHWVDVCNGSRCSCSLSLLFKRYSFHDSHKSHDRRRGGGHSQSPAAPPDYLEAVIGQRRRVDAIYVIDNASTDGTSDLIRDDTNRTSSTSASPRTRAARGGSPRDEPRL